MSLTFGVFFMARYDEDFKIEVAKHYLSALIGARLLAAQYGLNHGRYAIVLHRMQRRVSMNVRFGRADTVV